MMNFFRAYGFAAAVGIVVILSCFTAYVVPGASDITALKRVVGQLSADVTAVTTGFVGVQTAANEAKTAANNAATKVNDLATEVRGLAGGLGEITAAKTAAEAAKAAALAAQRAAEEAKVTALAAKTAAEDRTAINALKAEVAKFLKSRPAAPVASAAASALATASTTEETQGDDAVTELVRDKAEAIEAKMASEWRKLSPITVSLKDGEVWTATPSCDKNQTKNLQWREWKVQFPVVPTPRGFGEFWAKLVVANDKYTKAAAGRVANREWLGKVKDWLTGQYTYALKNPVHATELFIEIPGSKLPIKKEGEEAPRDASAVLSAGGK